MSRYIDYKLMPTTVDGDWLSFMKHLSDNPDHIALELACGRKFNANLIQKSLEKSDEALKGCGGCGLKRG